MADRWSLVHFNDLPSGPLAIPAFVDRTPRSWEPP